MYVHGIGEGLELVEISDDSLSQASFLFTRSCVVLVNVPGVVTGGPDFGVSVVE